MAKRPKSDARGALPDKAALLAYLRAHPDQGSVRDLSRAFGLKSEQRRALRALIAELSDEGAVARAGRRRVEPEAQLSGTMALEVSGTDLDGELWARPLEWTRDTPPPRILVLPGDDGGALAPGVRFIGRLGGDSATPTAKVLKRIGAPVHRVLGVYSRERSEGRVQPTDRKSRLTLLIRDGDEKGAKPGDIVLAEPLAGRVYGQPRARIAEVIGPMDAVGAISLISIYTHGIPDGFSAEVEAEAAAAQTPTLAGRTDLRALPLVTIDPDDARDHDDAVHAEPDPDAPGGFIVSVAIADVSAYVRPGTALDRAAYVRGNSTYFPDRVAPMLPEALSADLCSLKEGEPRAALCVRMHFNKDGRKTGHRFARVLMRSAARLTYAQVQAAIDGRPDAKTQPLLEPILKPLYAAYAVLRKGRETRQPLQLSATERRVMIGKDGKVESVAMRQSLPSMQLIEEFMIQANVAAAETLEERRTPLVYRVHDAPTREKTEALSEFLESLDVRFAKGQVLRPAVFNGILAKLAEGPFAALATEIVLRTQAQAVYAPQNNGHFGLNLARYAHFTSPIRRYADLIVHRALIRALRLGDDGLTDAEIAKLPEIAEQISSHERRSMAAEREAVERYLAAFMSERIGAVFTGRISGVSSFGVFVKLDETGADGLVPVRSLGGEFFQHDASRHALVGSRTGTMFGLGDAVEVRLLEAAPVTGGLRFEITAHQPLRQARGGPRGGKGRSRRRGA